MQATPESRRFGHQTHLHCSTTGLAIQLDSAAIFIMPEHFWCKCICCGWRRVGVEKSTYDRSQCSAGHFWMTLRLADAAASKTKSRTSCLSSQVDKQSRVQSVQCCNQCGTIYACCPALPPPAQGQCCNPIIGQPLQPSAAEECTYTLNCVLEVELKSCF